MSELMGVRDESCGDVCLFVCRLLDRALSISMVDGHQQETLCRESIRRSACDIGGLAACNDTGRS